MLEDENDWAVGDERETMDITDQFLSEIQLMGHGRIRKLHQTSMKRGYTEQMTHHNRNLVNDWERN